MQPEGGIKLGDTLSPAIYALVTTILVMALRKKVPGITQLLYADGALVWIPEGRAAVQRTRDQLMAAMKEYGDFLGQRLNVDKCEALLVYPTGY